MGLTRPPITGLTREAWRNLRAFRAAYAWLLRDLMSFSHRRVAAVIVLNLMGVVLQWSVVLAVLTFVSSLPGEGRAPVPLVDAVELPTEATFAVVTIWGVTVLALVVAAALSTYSAETIGFETARRYVARRGQDILGATLAAQSDPAPDGDAPARQLLLMLTRDQILRSLLVVQRSLRTVLMVAVAGVVLAFINPVLTGVVAFVAACFIVPYYLVNRRVVGAAATLEERSKSARLSVARLVEYATDREPSDEVMRVVPGLYPDAAVAARWTALRDITLAGQRTAALMSGLVGTCLVAVVVAFSVIIARGGTSWVAVLTYIVGLNLASGAFTQLAGQVTAANRFLPYVQDYVRFIGKAGPQIRPPSDYPTDERRGPLPSVRAVEPLFPTSERELALTPGVRAMCLWPGTVDRLNVHLVLARLVADSELAARRLRQAAFFYGDSAGLPPVSARVLLGATGTAVLAELELIEEINRLPQGAATVLTPEIEERLSPLLRYVLGALKGLEHELLVLGWKSFSRLSVEDRRRLVQVIGSRPLLFIFAGTPAKQPPEVTHTIILSEHGVAGMGEAKWYRSVTKSLAAEIPATKAPGRVAAGGDVDELLDEA